MQGASCVHEVTELGRAANGIQISVRIDEVEAESAPEPVRQELERSQAILRVFLRGQRVDAADLVEIGGPCVEKQGLLAVGEGLLALAEPGKGDTAASPAHGAIGIEADNAVEGANRLGVVV